MTKKTDEQVPKALEERAKTKVHNLRIWNDLRKTDPKHTKPFKRAGGFSGTAIKPIYIVERLTETFGPCGESWGINTPSFEVVHAQGGEVLVFCTVQCWYQQGDQTHTLVGVGGDKVVAGRSSGSHFHDDEAFKKAFTDAIGNAFKFLGIGADVHMGQFDDSKYVAELKAEFEKDPELDAKADALEAAIDKQDSSEKMKALVQDDDTAGLMGQLAAADPERFKKLRTKMSDRIKDLKANEADGERGEE